MFEILHSSVAIALYMSMVILFGSLSWWMVTHYRYLTTYRNKWWELKVTYHGMTTIAICNLVVSLCLIPLCEFTGDSVLERIENSRIILPLLGLLFSVPILLFRYGITPFARRYTPFLAIPYTPPSFDTEKLVNRAIQIFCEYDISPIEYCELDATQTSVTFVVRTKVKNARESAEIRLADIIQHALHAREVVVSDAPPEWCAGAFAITIHMPS